MVNENVSVYCQLLPLFTPSSFPSHTHTHTPSLSSPHRVAVGVDHFKSGRHEQARQILNHALDIDPSNVEGLVARGALSATTGLFKDGIADFRKARSLNASHKNARNYLLETQVVYGKR